MKFLAFVFIFGLSNFALSSDSPSIPEVAQREYIFTHSAEYPQVQTYGLATCIGLSIFQRESQYGLLAHIDARTELGQFESLFKNFKYQSVEELEVILIGQNKGLTYKKIKEKLQTLNIPFQFHLIKAKKNSSFGVMLNLITGKVLDYDELYPNTGYKKSIAKVNRLKFGKRLYRHEMSIGGGDVVEINPIELPFPF